MPEFNYTDSELKALKNQYASNASQEQFDLWIAECRTRGLVPVKDVVLQMRATKEYNPETRQKEFVKKAVHITTIQALRKLAERTGKYAGQLPSVWIYLGADGDRTESDIPLPESNGSKTPRIPWVAKVSVLRTGFQHPITVPARFEAYAQYYSDGGSKSLNSTWANRGPEQLEKCAEALALRKAFPEELGGLYLQEEFTDEETVAATAQPESVQKTDLSPNNGQPTPEKKRKKKESVPDAGKPWGGEFEAKTATTPGSPANAITPENPITDADVIFPGDPEPMPVKEALGQGTIDGYKEEQSRLATDDERKAFVARLIKLKDAGYTGIREYLLKASGETITNNIPFVRMQSLVNQLEDAHEKGVLKGVLEAK